MYCDDNSFLELTPAIVVNTASTLPPEASGVRRSMSTSMPCMPVVCFLYSVISTSPSSSVFSYSLGLIVTVPSGLMSCLVTVE